jgi:hypothetical protein
MPAKKLTRPFFVDAASRRHMIAVEAYILAEKRGFVSGSEVDDWITAERIVDQRLTSAAVPDKPERTKVKQKTVDVVAPASAKRVNASSKPATKQKTAKPVKRQGTAKPASKP